MSRVTGAFAQVLDRLASRRALLPRERFQVRFLLGAHVLGAAVAVPAIAVSVVAREWLSCAFIGAFLLGALAQIAVLRRGAGLSTMAWVALAALTVFLTVQCMIPVEVEPTQLHWLVLLPLAALALDDPAARTPPRRWWQRPPVVAAAVALVDGLLIIAAHGLGLSFGYRPSASGSAAAVTEHLTFVLAVGGMVFLYDLAMRQAQVELQTLRSLLSVCAWCRRIREGGQWVVLEDYVGRHHYDLTHGICPDCERRSFGR